MNTDNVRNVIDVVRLLIELRSSLSNRNDSKAVSQDYDKTNLAIALLQEHLASRTASMPVDAVAFARLRSKVELTLAVLDDVKEETVSVALIRQLLSTTR